MKKIVLLIFITVCIFLPACDFIKTTDCEHNYVFYSIEDSTCTKQGLKVDVCELCGKKYREIIPMKEHHYKYVEVEATCTNEGVNYQECEVCKSKTKQISIPKLNHDYKVEIIEATCKKEGYTLSICNKCEYQMKTNIVETLEHNYDEWIIIKEPTDLSDGLKERTCLSCGDIEQIITPSTSYVDLSLIKEAFDKEIIYEINKYQELSLKFQVAVVNQSEQLKCNINYQIDNFDKLLDDLVNDCNFGFSFGVNASMKGKSLTFNFTHQDEPSKKTSVIHYTQHNSFNYEKPLVLRTSDYDDFKINESLYSFKVKTTDQLVYALERGVKPICESGSSAEKAYDELKKILINIVHDGMTDYQKVKAIHDYLVMNITYDHELYNMLYSDSTSIKEYNGFYLEGALFDKVAVCEGISKAFTALSNIEGIPCVCVEGYQTKNPSGAGHAWNKVNVNGIWYILDATSDGTIIGNEFEVLSYKFFLIDEDTFKNTYTGENYTNIKCNDSYDVYGNSYFSINNAIYDFLIKSQQELDILILYFNSTAQNNLSIEFKLDFDFGSSAADEVQKAYQNNHFQANYSYIDSGNIFMILK